MAILRNPNKEKFTVVDNYALRDTNLSLKSRGLLVTMMSLPDNWHFSEAGLCAIFEKDGQSAIRSCLKELEQLGYLTRTRTRDSGGRVSNVVWTICDKPQLENPSVADPSVVNPNLENRPQLNTYRSNTDGYNTDGSNTESKGRKRPTPTREQYGEYGWVKLTREEHQRLVSEYGLLEVNRAITYVDESAQSTGNKNRWKDWNLVIRKCIRDGWGKQKVGNYGNGTGNDQRRGGSSGPENRPTKRLKNAFDFMAEDQAGAGTDDCGDFQQGTREIDISELF